MNILLRLLQDLKTLHSIDTRTSREESRHRWIGVPAFAVWRVLVIAGKSFGMLWLPPRDSNPDRLIQSQDM